MPNAGCHVVENLCMVQNFSLLLTLIVSQKSCLDHSVPITLAINRGQFPSITDLLTSQSMHGISVSTVVESIHPFTEPYIGTLATSIPCVEVDSHFAKVLQRPIITSNCLKT